MFNDAKEELERLAAALQEQPEEPKPQQDEQILNEEQLDALLGEDSRIADAAPEVLYKNNYSNRRKQARIYNSDKTEVSAEDLSQQMLRADKQKGIVGLVVLALLLTAGIFGLAVYWLLRYGGML